MNLIIRDAVEADLPVIVEIYNATVPTRMVTAELEPTTVEARLPWFREHSPDEYPFWVAESDDRVIGWLDFKKFLPRCAYRGTAEISVYVHEKFRRHGVGQRLLEEAIARTPSLGITALIGLIFGHNQPSLKLFERFGFERWGFFPAVAQLDGVKRDLVIVGLHCGKPCSHPESFRGLISAETTPHAGAPQPPSYNDCLNLMQALMLYRQQPIHSALQKIRDKYSMLHLDVLLLVYHFAKICSGLRDLERNLARHHVSDMVTLIKGRSFNPETISAVHQALGSDEIGLLILDADSGKRRDIECYRDKLAEGCWMVIDDYCGAASNPKSAPSRADVDALVAAGALEPLGFYGWSTWVGRWQGRGACCH